MKNDNLRGTFVPEINPAKCNSCGVCLRVCPGSEVDFKKLNKEFFGQQPSSSLLGNFLKCYSGHSNFFNSKTTDYVSSGGIATQLLVFALENGIIDGALVTYMSKEDPLKPEAIVATTVDEIVYAAGSKYCPCPTNLGLKYLLRKKGGRFAVVGVPCHIHAIRKAQLVFPELQEKILVTIGLFCAHATSFKGTEAVLRKLKLNKNQISKLAYRGHGWPGSLSVETTDGKSYRIPYSGSFKSYYPLFDSYFFVPWRCMFCQDHFNQLADISLGDAWLPEFRGSKVGQSLIVLRSDKGQQLIQRAISSRTITLREIQSEKIIRSQHGAVRFKSRDWSVRLSLTEKMGKKPPLCNVTNEHDSSIGSFVVNLSCLYSVNLRKNELARSVVNALPLWFFRVHNVVLSMLAKLP